MRSGFIILFFFFSILSFSQEQKLIDSLYRIVNTTTDDTTSINALCALSKEYCGTDNMKAFQLANEALEVSDKVENKKFKAQSLLRVGSTFDYRDQWDSALVFYLSSLKLYEQINDQSGIAGCYQNIGVMYYYQNQSAKAIEYYNKALSIRLLQKDWKYVAKLYNNIGAIFRTEKKYDDAIAIYRKSLALKTTMADKKGMSAAYLNLGIVFSFINHFDSAIYYSKKSLEIDLLRGDKHDIVSTQLAIGEIYLNNARPKEAVVYIKKGIELAKEINSNELLFNGYGYLAVADTLMGDFKMAYYHNKSFEYYQRLVINEKKSLEIEKLQALYQSEKKDASIKILKAEQIIKEKEQKLLYWTILTISLFLIVVILFYNRKRKDNIQLQKQKQEIIDKTELLKQQASEIAIFKTQINPHFIFNAINSVQRYIVSNNKEEAMTSLVDLSKLIRNTLNYSDKEYIELEEEIIFLKEYFKFEKLRSNYEMEMNVITEEGIEPANVLIPPMLIQPFIENAVKHGLLPKKAKGSIVIRFSKDKFKKFLNIEIIDDGIGLKNSKNCKLVSSHRSRGMDITNNRIELLYNKFGIEKSDFFTIEEVKKDSEIKGTIVNLVIPYIESF